MPTIASENQKILRQALDIIVTADETSEKPTSVGGTNFITGYSQNERVTEDGISVKVMDFCNGGFALDGNAQPLKATALPSGQKYGLISKTIAGSSGLFGWNQCIQNGNFTSTSNWSASYGTIQAKTIKPSVAGVAVAGITFVGNEYDIGYVLYSASSAHNANNCISQTFSGDSGHKVMAIAKVRNNASVSQAGVQIDSTGSTFSVDNNWRQMYCVQTLQSSGNHTLKIFGNCGVSTAKFEVRDAMVFDLTEIFGAGNEPTTYDEFKATPEYKRYFHNDYADYSALHSYPTVTINSTNAWDFVTLTLCDSKGNYSTLTYSDVQWSSGSTTIQIKSFTPNERMHLVKASLGKSWLFYNDNLITLTCMLRGVNTDIEDGSFSLEGSEIEFEAYIGADGDSWIDVISRMEENSPVSFTCGYQDDMSPIRRFYLNEADYDSEKKTIKISAYDATPVKLEGETGGKYITGTYTNTLTGYVNYLKSILTNAGVDYTTSGTMPTISDSTQCNVFIEPSSQREILAKAVSLNQNAERLSITYRDGGIPEFIIGDISTNWSINEEDTESFKTEIERNVKSYSADLYEYYVESEDAEIATQSNAVSGSIYFIDSSEPIYSVTTSGASLITPYKIKLTAQSSGDISITGKKIIKSTVASNNPYTDTDQNQRGITVSLGDMNLFKNGGSRGSLTKDCIHDFLESYNTTYSFTWRGNPHIKPMDFATIKRITSGGMVPNESLYPNTSVYPSEGSDVTIRITSVSLEFEKGGGLKSEIKGRRCS